MKKLKRTCNKDHGLNRLHRCHGYTIAAGQQATALLTVLLNQHGIPLLIDQPEDDIDNRAIDKIIKNLWEAKKKRRH